MSFPRLMPIDPRAATWRDIDPKDAIKERWLKISLYVVAILFVVASPFLRHSLLGCIQPEPDWCSRICLTGTLYLTLLSPALMALSVSVMIDFEKNAHEELRKQWDDCRKEGRCQSYADVFARRSLKEIFDARERGNLVLQRVVKDDALTPDEADKLRNLLEELRPAQAQEEAAAALEAKWQELKKELYILEGDNNHDAT